MNLLTRREFLSGAGFSLAAMAFPGIARATWISNNLKPYESFDFESWKWKTKAMHYSILPNGLRCDLCPNLCRIKPGDFGLCKTRYNHQGVLYSIAFGNPCAAQIDPIEKKPFFHFLPGTKAFSIATAGCNLACLNCQNWNISQQSPTETRNYDLFPAKVVERAIKEQCRSVAYTYSEPIVFYEYAFETAKLAREAGIKNLFKTAGYINEKPLRQIAPYLDGVNVDLKSFSDDVYQKLNAGFLAPVLKTIQVLKELNLWVEITNLVVPSWTDNLNMVREMCIWLKSNGLEQTPLHFSRFTPMHRLSQLPPTPVETLVKAREIAMQEGLQQVFIGNLPGKKLGNTLCPKCHKVLIERAGFNLVSNNLKDGKCPACKTSIAGVWE